MNKGKSSQELANLRVFALNKLLWWLVSANHAGSIQLFRSAKVLKSFVGLCYRRNANPFSCSVLFKASVIVVSKQSLTARHDAHLKVRTHSCLRICQHRFAHRLCEVLRLRALAVCDELQEKGIPLSVTQRI